MDRSSHMHRSTETTRTARRCQPMKKVNKFHSEYLDCRYYLLSDNTAPLCIMSPDKISVMSPSHICRRDIKQIQIHQDVESVDC